MQNVYSEAICVVFTTSFLMLTLFKVQYLEGSAWVWVWVSRASC